MSHVISPGQIYIACDPRDRGADDLPRRIHIHSIIGRENRAIVETLNPDGTRSRRRSMKLAYLHDSATTRTGQPRLRGYALEDTDR